MKNKIFIIVVILMLIFSVVGCSSSEPTDNTEENNGIANIDETEKDAEEVPDEVEEKPENDEIDSSLEDLDLLKSLTGERPEALKYKMVSEIYGTPTTIISYNDGYNTRTESIVEEVGTTVIIYNESEEAVYYYIEGDVEGMKFTDADLEDAEEAGLTIDLGAKFSDIEDDVIDEDDDEMVNFSAKVDTLDGEKVVYIETTQIDDEVGDITVKMWYSNKYGIPLKYEVFMNDKALMTIKVVEIEKDISIDKALFEAPSNIKFSDLSFDSLDY